MHLVASYEVFVFGADALVFFTAVGGASGYGGHTGGAFDMMPEDGHGVDQGTVCTQTHTWRVGLIVAFAEWPEWPLKCNHAVFW